jgi:hypothetical protein
LLPHSACFQILWWHSNTFEGIAFSLNSIIGTKVFVEAAGLGKGKGDLTEFVTDQSKPNQALSLS